LIVTRAKGFLGVWALKELLERGDRTWVFDIRTDTARLARDTQDLYT
jgi:nucleoside-diphosphate-sugar epimerase